MRFLKQSTVAERAESEANARVDLHAASGAQAELPATLTHNNNDAAPRAHSRRHACTQLGVGRAGEERSHVSTGSRRAFTHACKAKQALKYLTKYNTFSYVLTQSSP